MRSVFFLRPAMMWKSKNFSTRPQSQNVSIWIHHFRVRNNIVAKKFSRPSEDGSTGGGWGEECRAVRAFRRSEAEAAHFRFCFLDLCIRFGKIISKVCEGFNSGAKKLDTNFRFSKKVGFSFFESDCSAARPSENSPQNL